MKNNKAFDEDEIKAELWKVLDDDIILNLKSIIDKIWEDEELPEDWKTAIIHPLYKKGPKTISSNYGGISLFPATYKILSKAVQNFINRAESQLNPQLGEHQGGFGSIDRVLNRSGI